MRRHTGWMVMTALCLLAALCGPTLGARKPLVAVLRPLAPSSPPDWWDAGAEAMQDVFVTELRDSGKLAQVKSPRDTASGQATGKRGGKRRADLEARTSAALMGPAPREAALRAGKALGVGYVLASAVSVMGFGGGADRVGQWQTRTRLIDTSTGEIVWADEVTVPATKVGLEQASRRLAESFVSNVPGRVRSPR